MSAPGDASEPAPPLLLYTDPKSGGLVRRRWRLRVLDGPDEGREAWLDQDPAIIGAVPNATLLLTDDTVSRYHLEIDLFSEGLRIRDLDSTNGTFVGSRRIREAFIEAGGSFRIGRTIAIAEPHDRPEPIAPAPVQVSGEVAVDATTRTLLGALELVARSSSTVLLHGEPGSGKTTLARRLHHAGPRRDRPLVELDLAGLDMQEAEARLSGVRDGRSIGPGAIERAGEGTLVLENVDRLGAGGQVHLFITIDRGAASSPEPGRLGPRLMCRLVATALRPLGQVPGFNRQLLRRLGVVSLPVPALRERPDDLVPLAEAFAAESGLPPPIFGEHLVHALRNEPWRGNLVELREALEALVQPTSTMDEDGLEGRLRRGLVTDVVSHRRGDVTRAAADLVVEQRELFRYLARHQVDLDAM